MFPALEPSDFAPYGEREQRDREYDAQRLVVRRKLEAQGKLAQRLLTKEAALTLACRTSLHHPSRYAASRVSSQRAYLSRTPADKKALVARIGPAIGEDVDTHYIQTTFELRVDATGYEQALRIHKMAWWDGQNLLHRTREPAELAALLDILNALPQGFVLLMDNWRKEYLPGSLTRHELGAYFARYTPGEHWLHLRRRIPAECAIDLGTRLADFNAEAMLALVPVYRFVCWSPENDWLFDAQGKVRRL